MVKQGETPETIMGALRKDSDDFEKRRAPYLLYK
jgi:hypothetical protein